MSMPPPPPPPPPGFNPPPVHGAPPPPQPFGAPQPQYGAPPPGYQAYRPQRERQLAGLGARFVAVLIDLLVGALFYAPAVIAFFAVPKHYTDCTVNGEAGICKVPNAAGWAAIVGLGLVGLITYVVLYCKKVGNSQSWGQKAMGVRVVDKDTGAQIGTGRSVGRFFARSLSAAFCYLGYLWAIWDKDNQTWHDKIVGTVVVKA